MRFLAILALLALPLPVASQAVGGGEGSPLALAQLGRLDEDMLWAYLMLDVRL